MEKNLLTHNCKLYLRNGNCQICGTHHHAWVQNGGGNGIGLAISWCYYCHRYEAYYDDTGSTVSLVNAPDLDSLSIHQHDCDDFIGKDGTCIICKKNYPNKSVDAIKSLKEPLYIAYKYNDKYFISGFIDRKKAENYMDPIFHFTVIVVAFISDGDEKGKFLVVDRTPRQWAKAVPTLYNFSINFFGGHVKADITNEEVIGQEAPQHIFDESAKREIAEELLIRSSKKDRLIEIWEDKKPTGTYIGVEPYNTQPLVPIGMSEFNNKTNNEFSFVYCLPIPSTDVPKLLAAEDDGNGNDIYLQIHKMSEMDLLKVPYEQSNSELCDAIYRIWDKRNEKVYRKLMKTIKNYPETVTL